MARISLQLPSKAPMAVLHIPVRITDINYGNHLGNDAMVSIMHEARVQFLNQHGFTEMQAGGTSLIMSDLCVQFKSEGFYGDQLTVEIICGEVSKVSFELFYRVSAKRGEEFLLIALGKTTMISYNYTVSKICPLPQKLKEIL